MDSQVSFQLGCLMYWRLTWLPVSTHHNIFERHHRFIGWMGLAVNAPRSNMEVNTNQDRAHGVS